MIPILLGAGAVAAAGAAAGQLATRRVRDRYPAPGRLVDIGGYRLHLECEGEGQPAVVLESGVGDIGITWAGVLPEIAGFTRVCAYDRAGLGWSDASRRPRTAAVMVEELRALLSGAGVAPPYVLVAQSFGALPATLLASTHRDVVAGMVLVDPAHPDQIERAPQAVRDAYRRMARMIGPMFTLPRALAASGVYALRPGMVPMMGGGPIPEAVGEERYRALLARGAGGFRTLTAEMEHLEESRAQVRAAMGPLGDLPLVVLSAGEEAPLPVPEEARQANAVVWRELHRELAALSSRGRVEVVDGSGHMIHHERPEVVVGAIREVVEAARGG